MVIFNSYVSYYQRVQILFHPWRIPLAHRLRPRPRPPCAAQHSSAMSSLPADRSAVALRSAGSVLICWVFGTRLGKKNDSGPGTGRGLRWMGQRNPINHQFCMVETCWNPRNNGMFTIYQLQDFATIHGRWLRFKEKLIDSAIDVLLVGGDWNMNFIFPYIIYWESCWLVQHLGIILWLSIQLGVFIIPTDELTPSFFRGVAKNHQPDCHRFWFIFGMIQTFCCPCFLCAEIGHEFGHQK